MSGRASFLLGVLLLASLDSSGSTAATQATGADSLDIPRTQTVPGVEDAPFPYVDAAEVGLDANKLAALADSTLAWVARDRIVGAEILIVKDRTIVLHETIGWSDREARLPLQRNTIFRLRSMTKPYTGTAILLLVEADEVELDAPVGRYLPSWSNGRSSDITIEQLLTHTSGFVQGGTPEKASSYASLRDLVDACGEQGPQNPPGEGFVYSDVNSFALGAIVEEITGAPLGRFIETRILEPLGLDDTHIGYTPTADWAARDESDIRVG